MNAAQSSLAPNCSGRAFDLVTLCVCRAIDEEVGTLTRGVLVEAIEWEIGVVAWVVLRTVVFFEIYHEKEIYGYIENL